MVHVLLWRDQFKYNGKKKKTEVQFFPNFLALTSAPLLLDNVWDKAWTKVGLCHPNRSRVLDPLWLCSHSVTWRCILKSERFDRFWIWSHFRVEHVWPSRTRCRTIFRGYRKCLLAAPTSSKMLQHSRQYLGNRSSYEFAVNGIGIGKMYSACFWHSISTFSLPSFPLFSSLFLSILSSKRTNSKIIYF